MTVMTLTPRPSTAPAPTADPLAVAATRLYDAEFALHAARQTGVDAWIVAAYDKLHAALAAHTAALRHSTTGHPTAA
jgi:hypothetical protein